MRDNSEEIQLSTNPDESTQKSAVLSAEEYYRISDKLLLFGNYREALQNIYKANELKYPDEQNDESIPQNDDMQNNSLPRIFMQEVSRYHNVKQGETYLLGPGNYAVGTDIPQGRCDLCADRGVGSFCVYSKAVSAWTLRNPIGITDEMIPSRFRNLTLMRGDRLEINGNVTVLLSPPVSIINNISEVLSPGIYRFGVDIPTGKYNIKVHSGEGEVLLVNIKKYEFEFYQDMADNDATKANEYRNLVCTRNNELWINGSLEIKLKPVQEKGT